MEIIISILSWTFGAISAVVLYPVLVLSAPFINQSQWVWFVGFLLRGVMRDHCRRSRAPGEPKEESGFLGAPAILQAAGP